MNSIFNDSIDEEIFMTQKIIVSVIIPTYNRLDYLKQCLKSLSSQTLDKKYFHFEVII